MSRCEHFRILIAHSIFYAIADRERSIFPVRIRDFRFALTPPDAKPILLLDKSFESREP
jgi:hypothetical protein